MTSSPTLRIAPPRVATLRIATAGSVDDGKSTLIGRLLHDTKTVFEDQLAAVEKASRRYGDGERNLALLTDGLRAEREQGITIDVAHRYFATPRRSFIVADTPGHAQYTRNMVTGASTADVAIVLVDARHGVLEQTRRHAFIASLLGVKAIALAVNKMDLVDWDEGEFDSVAKDLAGYVEALPTPVPVFAFPISALHGDNVVEVSERSPWYEGTSLLEWLETFDASAVAVSPARLDVQRVIRPQGSDFRGFAGRLSGGSLRGRRLDHGHAERAQQHGVGHPAVRPRARHRRGRSGHHGLAGRQHRRRPRRRAGCRRLTGDGVGVRSCVLDDRSAAA